MSKASSIAISATDNFTVTLTKMRTATQAFRKDIEGAKAKVDALNSTKASLKLDFDQAKKNIQEARKELKLAEEGTEAFDKAMSHLEDAHKKEINIADNLKLITSAAKDAQKELKDLGDTTSKLENRAGGASGALGGIGNIGGVFSSLGNQAFGMMQDAAGVFIKSAFGREDANIVNGILSGAISGGISGAMMGGGAGAAIGAVGGGVMGALQGVMKNWEDEEEAFKDYRNDLYNTVMENQENSIYRGSESFKKKETELLAFRTLLNGDAEAAAKFRKELVEMSRNSPLTYDVLSGMAKDMLALGHNADDATERIRILANAAAGGGGEEQAAYIVSFMDQILETGKVSESLVSKFSRKGIEIKDALAGAFMNEATGKVLKSGDVMEFIKHIGENGATGADVVEAIYKFMDKKYSGSMENYANTAEGIEKRLAGLKGAIGTAMGEGYSEERKRGMLEEISWFDKYSEQEKEANRLIGEWKASLENLEEQYKRDAREALYTGVIPASIQNDTMRENLKTKHDEYVEAQRIGDSREMGRLLAETEAAAINEYHASEGYQELLRTQVQIVEDLTASTVLDKKYHNFGYKMQNAMSKGMLAGAIENIENVEGEGYGALIGIARPALEASGINSYLKKTKGFTFDDYLKYTYGGPGLGKVTVYSDGKEGSIEHDPDKKGLGTIEVPRLGNAWGLDRVPYDGYRTILHEGERVKTANQARQEDRAASAPQITITVNVTGHWDTDEVAYTVGQKIAREIQIAQMLS